MAHLAGIDKGPVLDWTDDNGLLEQFRKWKKKVKILFRGPLTTTNDAVKCNYIIYWSGEIGMELVDKWETKDKSNDGKSQWHCEIPPIVWGAHLSEIKCSHRYSRAQETVPGNSESGRLSHEGTQASERSWISRGSNMEQSTLRHYHQWSSLW